MEIDLKFLLYGSKWVTYDCGFTLVLVIKISNQAGNLKQEEAVSYLELSTWRGARVVESDGLESLYLDI